MRKESLELENKLKSCENDNEKKDKELEVYKLEVKEVEENLIKDTGRVIEKLKAKERENLVNTSFISALGEDYKKKSEECVRLGQNMKQIGEENLVNKFTIKKLGDSAKLSSESSKTLLDTTKVEQKEILQICALR